MDVLLVNCFNSADIKLSLVSSHRTREAWSGQAQLLGRYVYPVDYLHSLTHMHPYIHPFIHTSIHTYIHRSIYPSIYSSIHPFQAASTEATSRATRCMEKASSLARTVPSMTATGKPTCDKAWVQRSTAMAGTYDAAMMMML